MTRSLGGKVVAITGGARGIGAATAAALAREGAQVAIGDLERQRAERLAGRLGLLALPLDVTDRPGFTDFLDEIERRLGPIDVLINNAGVMLLSPFEDETDEAAARQLEVNVHAVMHGTREAIRRMRPRTSGHIVNVASMAGKSGFPGAATYCATKHAIVGLSEAVRHELRGSGVRISCVMPVVVRTELAGGLPEMKLFPQLSAEDVAKAIVEELKRPRFDVYVPRSLELTTRIARLVPRRAAEWFMRAVGADRVFTRAEPSARAEYEAKVQES